MYNLNSKVMNRAMRVAPINNNIKTEAIVLQFFNEFIECEMKPRGLYRA